jgi:dTDP-4-dehydrorhamnose reductase
MGDKIMRIMLTGPGGQVGWELNRSLTPYGVVGAYGSDALNLSDEPAIREAVRGFRPDVIVNAAAYTAVDRAETERDACRRLNAEAPGVLAEEAEKLGAWLIHFSTDYVYGGKGGRPWREDDEPCPVNYYGESKLAGDIAVSARSRRHLIFRTSWVYASRGSNFLLTMLRLFAADRADQKNGKKREVHVVDDQVGAPTWARFLAQAATLAIKRAVELDDTRVSGVYHLVCGGSTSWYGFAREILEYAGKYFGVDRLALIPIQSKDYVSPAARPAWSVLSTEKSGRAFGVYAVPWQEAARLCMDEIRERRGPE